MANEPLRGFAEWVAGDLTGNRMRGLYAEWMISSALGVIDDSASRVEWDMVDVRYNNLNIEVKTSGNRQQWSSEETPPRFSIAQQSRVWNANLNKSEQIVPPRRTADVYIFCLHTCEKLTTSAVKDETNWTFMLLPTAVLDKEFDRQRTVSPKVLTRLGNWVHLDDVCEQIQQL